MSARSLPPILDGLGALERLVGDNGLPATLGENTVFLHPDTVAKTKGSALFPVIRKFAMRGQPDVIDGRHVICCDNDTPTRAFLWSAGRARGRDVQYNHVWMDSQNPDTYTALWNLCVTPSFLAKLTDGKHHPDTVALLQYRAYDLYGHKAGDPPTKPAGYDDLRWHEPPEPAPDLESVLRQRLQANPRSRAAVAARTIGWLFSDWKPDTSFGAGNDA